MLGQVSGGRSGLCFLIPGQFVVVFCLSAVLVAEAQAARSKVVSEVHCFREGHKGNLVFLHGMSNRFSLIQESSSFKTIGKIAKKLKVCAAAPRSALTCSGGKKLCWNMYRKKEKVQRLLQAVTKASSHCLNPAKPVIYIGFSNGGYLVNKWAQWCLLKAPDALVSIGAAGSLPGGVTKGGHCSTLHLMASRQEMVFEQARAYFQNFQQRIGNIVFKTYRGGHRVPYMELKALLGQLIEPDNSQ